MRKNILMIIMLMFTMLLPFMTFIPTKAYEQALNWEITEIEGVFEIITDTEWETDFFIDDVSYTMEAETIGWFDSWYFDIQLQNTPMLSEATFSRIDMLLKGEDMYGEYKEIGCRIRLTDYLVTDHYDLFMVQDDNYYWIKETSDTWVDVYFERQWNAEWEMWCTYMELDGYDCYFYDTYIPDPTLEQNYIAYRPEIPPMYIEGWKQDELYEFSDPLVELTMSVTPLGTGTTNPIPGIHGYTEGDQVIIQAFPGEDYIFGEWIINDVGGYMLNPYNLTMNENKAVVAHFVLEDEGGCPMLYVFKDGEFLYEGLLNIHDPNGTDIIYGETLSVIPIKTNGGYLFTLEEHPQTISSIDEVKLFAVEDGESRELNLVSAVHSDGTNVKQALSFSDDVDAVTRGSDHTGTISETISLKFEAPTTTADADYFIFQIEGNNKIIKQP